MIREIHPKETDEILRDELFQRACKIAQLTGNNGNLRRQARKWLKKKGLAYANRHIALHQLRDEALG